MKDTIIKSVDRLSDITDMKRPKGHVHIYEDVGGRKRLLHKDNLIVYIGREMLAQRLVNKSNPYFSGDTSKPTKDEFVSWFGLGNGGVSSSDPLTPVAPILTDEYLYSPIPMIDSQAAGYSDFHNAGSSFAGGGEYGYTGSYVKAFDTTGEDAIQFYQDDLNDNRYVILQITTTIGINDANGYQVSEAGLFSAEDGVSIYGHFTLFARITFPTLIKTSDRRLIFVWYLYL